MLMSHLFRQPALWRRAISFALLAAALAEVLYLSKHWKLDPETQFTTGESDRDYHFMLSMLNAVGLCARCCINAEAESRRCRDSVNIE